MSERKEAREKIADIIARADGDRTLELWHSDIARMTDMLLWLYTDFAKPMTYSKGNLIELDRASDGTTKSSIEKISDRYIVNINGETADLRSISAVATLRFIQKELLKKEFYDWDYWCDMVGDE